MKNTILAVLIVISGSAFGVQICNDAIPFSTPNARFTVDGDEVTDHVSGLIWRRCTLGWAGADCGTGSDVAFTWQEALDAASEERVATGQAWRLPNVKELESLVEERCHSPSANVAIFPNTQSAGYWSASPHATAADAAWGADFEYGRSFAYLKDVGYRVRLVRDDQ